MSERLPSVIVVSAPSGAGKSTVLARVLDDMPGLRFSVSHTTRPPRPGERDGVEYHFVDRRVFEGLRDDGKLLEWAEVHGNLYGTGLAEHGQARAEGVDLLLDVDVQGAAQVRE
ncbi:MAG: guanylate kinase, partial [Acidobacteriota bacterium]